MASRETDRYKDARVSNCSHAKEDMPTRRNHSSHQLIVIRQFECHRSTLAIGSILVKGDVDFIQLLNNEFQ
jgi:hypothetical protein